MPGGATSLLRELASAADNFAGEPFRRLGFALLISALVHAALLYGVRLRPGGASSSVTILSAQLVADEADAGSPAESSASIPATVPQADRESLKLPAARGTTDKQDRPASKRSVSPPAPSAQRAPRAASTTGVRQSQALREVAVPIPRDPTWYPARQLDELPRALMPIQAKWPQSVSAGAPQGRVVLLLLIDESGAVTEVSVVEAVPAGYFEESALAATRAARFTPGSKDGRIVKSRVLMELNYGVPEAVGR